MFTIGIGNGKGGVGSTTLTIQLAALLQRTGATVTIVSAPNSEALPWCTDRAANADALPGGSKGRINYMPLKDCWGRLKNCDLGSDFALLDYSNGEDLAAAMSHVEDWICPFTPLEVRPTLATYRLWQALHPDALETGETFSAVLSMTPSEADIAEDPSYAKSRYNGEDSAAELAQDAPTMHIMRQRIRWSEAVGDIRAGGDVFSSSAPDAPAARAELNAVWVELLIIMGRGGVLPGTSALGLSARQTGRFRSSKGAPPARPQP